MTAKEKFLKDNANDRIVVDGGDLFEGTRDQFRDNFFDNADDYQIIRWCLDNWSDLEIKGEKIITNGKLVNAHGYLGETYPNLEDTPFHSYTPADWAMEFISRYGQIDGDHHKAWVLDQVARILKGTKVYVKLAVWLSGEHDWRLIVEEPSLEYKLWVEEMKGEFDGDEYQYTYEEGIAP